MSHPYSYMVIDCTPKMPCELKVHTNIFPGEITWDLFKKTFKDTS